MLSALAVILQRFQSRGLVSQAHHRQITDLQQFRRREKHHIHRIIVNRIAQAALVNHQRPHPRALRLHGARQSGRPRSHPNEVICGHLSSIRRSSRSYAYPRGRRSSDPCLPRSDGSKTTELEAAPPLLFKGQLLRSSATGFLVCLSCVALDRQSVLVLVPRNLQLHSYNLRLPKIPSNSSRNFSNSATAPPSPPIPSLSTQTHRHSFSLIAHLRFHPPTLSLARAIASRHSPPVRATPQTPRDARKSHSHRAESQSAEIRPQTTFPSFPSASASGPSHQIIPFLPCTLRDGYPLNPSAYTLQLVRCSPLICPKKQTAQPQQGRAATYNLQFI